MPLSEETRALYSISRQDEEIFAGVSVGACLKIANFFEAFGSDFEKAEEMLC